MLEVFFPGELSLESRGEGVGVGLLRRERVPIAEEEESLEVCISTVGTEFDRVEIVRAGEVIVSTLQRGVHD
jgi:hypothetical protein